MITIRHYHDGSYHWTVTETDQGRTYLRNTYAMGWDEPHYQVPATLDLPVSFITALWLNAKGRRQLEKTQRWWLALCFDQTTGHYLG